MRKRNLIKRLNETEDYDPLFSFIRLIFGLLRLKLFYDGFRVDCYHVHKYSRRARGYGT